MIASLAAAATPVTPIKEQIEEQALNNPMILRNAISTYEPA